MVPGLEAIGIRVLLNECEPILRGNHAIHLAGIDDAHHYRLDDIAKAAAGIPQTAFSILLSHTPEVYREAASAGFDLLLGRAHAWRPDLPARRDPDHARFGPAAAHGFGSLGLSAA